MNHDHPSSQHLPADDPRLSDWLDGRLSPAEAVEVERLVAASPELSLLVADLRRLKGSLAALPATPPPTTFVADVMAALDPRPAVTASEAARSMHRSRWPWLALAGALAASVVVAVAIIRPPKEDVRETAMLGENLARREDAAAEVAAPAADKVAAESAKALFRDAAASAGAAKSAPPAKLDRAGEFKPAEAVLEAEDAIDQDLDANGVMSVVTMRIRGVADRKRLDALLAASGLDLVANQDAAEESRERNGVFAKARQMPAERIEVAGPPAAIAALVADLEALQSENQDLARRRAAKGQAQGEQGGIGGANSARQERGRELSMDATAIVRRLMILVVDETAPGAAAGLPAAPAAPPPAGPP